MFSFIYAWIKGWENNREAGDLRRHRAHYNAIVMIMLRRPHHSYKLKKSCKTQHLILTIQINRFPNSGVENVHVKFETEIPK